MWGRMASCGPTVYRPWRANPPCRAPAPLRLGELGVVDRHVLAGFPKLNREAAVDPRQGPAKWYLDAVHFAVIGVVDLRGAAANRRIGIAHLPQQQAGGLVEVKPHWRLALAHADQRISRLVADLIGAPHAETGEDFLDVRGKVEIGI